MQSDRLKCYRLIAEMGSHRFDGCPLWAKSVKLSPAGNISPPVVWPWRLHRLPSPRWRYVSGHATSELNGFRTCAGLLSSCGSSPVRRNSQLCSRCPQQTTACGLWRLHALTLSQDPPPGLPSGQSGLTLPPILSPAQPADVGPRPLEQAGDARSAGPRCQSEPASNGTMRCPGRDTSLSPHPHNASDAALAGVGLAPSRRVVPIAWVRATQLTYLYFNLHACTRLSGKYVS